MENQEQTVEQKQEEAGKVQKQFEATMKKLVAVVGGEKQLLPTKKLDKDVVGTIVEGLLKDKKESLEKEVKSDLVSLLDKHIELKKSIEAKKKELKQLEEQKMKEFSEAASKVFNKIDGIAQMETDYYNSLNQAGNSSVEVKK